MTGEQWDGESENRAILYMNIYYRKMENIDSTWGMCDLEYGFGGYKNGFLLVHKCNSCCVCVHVVPIWFPFNKNTARSTSWCSVGETVPVVRLFGWTSRTAAIVFLPHFCVGFFFPPVVLINEFLHCAVGANPWPFIKSLVVQSCRDCLGEATTVKQVCRDKKWKADAVFFLLPL